MLVTKRIHRPWSLDQLFDDDQWCPVCKGTKFTEVEGLGIYCDQCQAEFSLRDTTGDPGVVIDCEPATWTYYPIPRAAWTKKERPVFWQVLKPCNDGLDDRQRWCTNLDISDLGENRNLWLRKDDPPMGKMQDQVTRQEVIAA